VTPSKVRLPRAAKPRDRLPRSVIDSIRQVIFRADARGRWEFLNAAWTEITGFTVADCLGTSFLSFVHPDDREQHAEVFQRLLAEGAEYFAHEARYLTVAGGFRWMEIFAQLDMDARGAVQGIFGTLADITERRRAEAELLGTRARMRHLLDSSPAVIHSSELAPPHPFTFVSENITRQLGYEVDTLLDDPDFWLDCVHPDDAARVARAAAAVMAEGEQRLRYRVRHRDGGYRWIHDERRLVRDAEGHPVEVVGSWVDVTDQKRGEDERARLHSVIEQAAESIVITRVDGTIEYVNPAFERLTGYTRAELIGETPRMLNGGTRDERFFADMWATLGREGAWAGRFVNRRKDGTLFETEAVVSSVRDDEGVLVNYVAAMHDVTHERRMEEELRQAQKMEIAGRLAGGVAHDFNNVLTIITGHSQLLLARLAADAPERHDVEQIEDGARRAAALTRQLLIFSRKQDLAPSVLNLNEIVEPMDKMLRRLIGEDVELRTTLGPRLHRVKADPGQIEQVVMNLAVNARDAMPRGGRLVIETANVDLDETYAADHLDVRPGAYVMIAVTDTGAGMTEETRAHIFEPFFTTKGPDKGTGLGLSTVYGIVKQSDGHIDVQSAPGQGATFRVYLPRVDETPLAPAPAPKPAALLGGSETILLVEDEDGLRDLAADVLQMHGYTVLAARDGDEALGIGERHHGRIDLLMTDVVMPHVGGHELARRLLERRPDVRVLYMSGYTDDAILRDRLNDAEVAMLCKPFTPNSLARTVREVLDGRPPVASF
jgi:PAS domain S-box-containing protein